MTSEERWNAARAFLRGFWKFFAGGVVVLVAFAGNFFDLRQPKVAVEITGIEQRTSAAIDVSAVPGFENFWKLTSAMDPFSGSREKYNADSMKLELDRSKLRLADQRNEFLKLREKATAISEKAAAPLAPKARDGTARNTLDELPLFAMSGDQILKQAPEKIKAYLAESEDRLRTRENLIANAESEVKSFQERSEKSDAKIRVFAAVSNTGDGSTTLKPQALLRTDLGQGNYLDINLKISGYETGVGDIKPRGTSVLIFESDPINQMAPTDRDRFLSFFKNTSPTNLYVVDVRNQYYRSNTIPFAQGIYEQKIYDGIKGYASKIAQ